jgi:hypothetical protein
MLLVNSSLRAFQLPLIPFMQRYMCVRRFLHEGGTQPLADAICHAFFYNDINSFSWNPPCFESLR